MKEAGLTELRVVHYLNQFFAGVGSEERADAPPTSEGGVMGPGNALQAALGGEGVVVGTVFCGDNYINERADALPTIIGLIRSFRPDLVVAGPAFGAGRFGLACAQVCEAVQEQLKIPAVSGIYPHNPSVKRYSSNTYIAATTETAAGMTKAIQAMVKLGLKLAKGERLDTPEEDGYLPNMPAGNQFLGQNGSHRPSNTLFNNPRPTFSHRYTPEHQVSRVALFTQISGSLRQRAGSPYHRGSISSKIG